MERKETECCRALLISSTERYGYWRSKSFPFGALVEVLPFFILPNALVYFRHFKELEIPTKHFIIMIFGNKVLLSEILLI